MSIILAKAKPLLLNIYDECLKQQLEMFSYNSNDRSHIYLNKYYLFTDTLLRMLSIYIKLINDVGKIKYIYLCITSEFKLEPLKLATINNEITTKATLLNNILEILSRVQYLINGSDKSFYINIERYINKYISFPISYKSIQSSADTDVSNRISKKDHKRKISQIDLEISQNLAPFQMRLDEEELQLCFNLLLAYLPNTSIYKFNDENIDASSIFSYIKTKLNNKLNNDIIILQFEQKVQKFIVHSDVKYAIYNKDMKIKLEDPYTRYSMIQKYKIKEKRSDVIYCIPNLNAISVIKASLIQSSKYPLKRIFEYLDYKYCETLMYINTYLSTCSEDADALYLNKSFRTPRYDEFDDTDLALCTYDTFRDNLKHLLTNFNKIFGINVILN